MTSSNAKLIAPRVCAKDTPPAKLCAPGRSYRGASNLGLSRGGFTLIELLVVIAIIAILAGILIPGVQTAMRSAEVRRARLEIASIVTAAQAYYSEYGVWPCGAACNGQPDRTYGSMMAPAANRQNVVIDILTGINNADNRRRITFLEVKDTSRQGTDKDGTAYAVNDGYYLDPWGNPYLITFDTNFDEDVTLEHISYLRSGAFGSSWIPVPTVADNPLRRLRVAVYSLGPAATADARWSPLSHAEKTQSAILSWID